MCFWFCLPYVRQTSLPPVYQYYTDTPEGGMLIGKQPHYFASHDSPYYITTTEIMPILFPMQFQHVYFTLSWENHFVVIYFLSHKDQVTILYHAVAIKLSLLSHFRNHFISVGRSDKSENVKFNPLLSFTLLKGIFCIYSLQLCL